MPSDDPDERVRQLGARVAELEASECKLASFIGEGPRPPAGGVTTSSLTAHMTNGTRHRLLRPSMEPARRLLRDRLVVGACPTC